MHVVQGPLHPWRSNPASPRPIWPRERRRTGSHPSFSGVMQLSSRMESCIFNRCSVPHLVFMTEHTGHKLNFIMGRWESVHCGARMLCDLLLINACEAPAGDDFGISLDTESGSMIQGQLMRDVESSYWCLSSSLTRGEIVKVSGAETDRWAHLPPPSHRHLQQAHGSRDSTFISQ